MSTSLAARIGRESHVRPTSSKLRTPTRSIVLAGDYSVEYLDLEDLVELARRLFGEPPPIADLGLLGAAAARPQASAFGRDAYDDLWSKAAALLQSIVKSHPLVDGNKRLGWLATAVFLSLNGIAADRASNDDVFEFVVDVAAHDRGVEAIAAGLKRIVGARRT